MDGARRVRIRDESGRILVSRAYGGESSRVVLLPDGSLGWPKGEAFTEEPFRPATAEELGAKLIEGPLRGFQVLTTAHYVVVYQGTPSFATTSANFLESLYRGLFDKLQARGFPVNEAEFPLVAVIYRDEKAFRAHSEVPEDVRAFFDVISNRISLYETSEHDQDTPDVAALRRPQTLAHEGTHQILQNIGVHPRLASWPPWLVEGLAEYFAPTTVTRSGEWDGANRVNPFHMATIRDLHDPTALQLGGREQNARRIGRDSGRSLVENLVRRKELTPTDYALAWALTHYLANRRFEDLIRYLKELGSRPIEQDRTPEEELKDFRAFFGTDLSRLDRALNKHLAGLKGYEELVYYAVLFEQPLGRGIVRRAAIVSQSPAMIRQWVEEVRTPEGGQPVWHAWPFPTRSRARLAAENWFKGA